MKKGFLLFPILFLALLFISLFFLLSKAKETVSIAVIAQTGREKEALKTDYLAYLLTLSRECPILDLSTAKRKLLNSPLIEKASVKLIGKKTLYIDYQLRMPILFLEDFPNVLIDEKGYLFPLSPFFTPKKFPSLYLGKTFFNSLKSTSLWKTSLKGREIDVALTLHHLLEEKRKIAPFTVERIDLSCMYTDSLGKREIILVLKNKEGSFHFLRLQPRKLGKQLDNYFLLRSKLLKGKSQVIDLRIPKSAFISDV